MKAPWTNLEGPAKALAISVTVLLVASGLCGMQIAIMKVAGQNAPVFTTVFMITGLIELGVMVLSAVVVVAALIVMICAWIYSRFTEE
jgi:hypothetical protein